MTLPIACQTCHKVTALNCHFVVGYPKALQSSGPLDRRHAQSHPSSRARALAHVTCHARPAEAAVLIRFATAICDQHSIA